MRTDRLLALADFVEQLPPAKFDMMSFGRREPKCGTTACLGGWAVVLFAEEDGWAPPGDGCTAEEAVSSQTAVFTHRAFRRHCGVPGVAQRVLDMGVQEASEMFLSSLGATRELAARMLRETAATGVVPRWWAQGEDPEN